MLSKLKIDYLRHKRQDSRQINWVHPKRPKVMNDPLTRFSWFRGHDCMRDQGQCLA
jgi:hypothetical protein